MKYKAFISYSHAADGHLAPAIQKTLQVLAKPWYQEKVFDIFLDKTDLSISPQLWGTIEEALKESEYLILMASPDAAQSKWVKKEVEFWLRYKSIDTIIIVLTDGIIKWDDQTNDFEWTKKTSLPESLRGKYKGVPNYVDFRFVKKKSDLSLDTEEFNEAIRPIAAKLHDQTVAELFGVIKKQHKKTLRIRNGIILTLLFFLFFLTFFAIKFYVEKRNVQIQLSRNYWENARNAREKGMYLYSLHLFAEAVTINPDPLLHKNIFFDMFGLQLRFPLLNIFKHRQPINKAIFDKNEVKILTCSDDDTARVWNANTGKQIVPALSHKRNVKNAVFNNDGSRILTWTNRHSLILWDAITGKQIRRLLEQKLGSNYAIFNADGTRFLTWFITKTPTRLWNANTGQQIGSNLQHEGDVNGAIFNADGTKIITCSNDKTVRIWDANTGKKIGPDFEHHAPVYGVTLNKDGTRILSWSGGKKIRIWDIAKAKQIGPTLETGSANKGAKFNNNDTRILIWDYDNKAMVWDAISGNPIGKAVEHSGKILGARFFKNKQNIITWSANGTSIIWDIHTGRLLGYGFEHKKAINGVAFNHDEKKILTWSKKDNSAFLWKAIANKNMLLILEHEIPVNLASFGFNDTRVITWSQEGALKIWDTSTGQLIKWFPVKVNGNSTWQAQFSAQKSQILTWSQEGITKIWDTRTCQQIGPGIIHKSRIKGARFCINDARMLTWGDDNIMRIWDTNSGKQIAQTSQNPGPVKGAIFKSDGTKFLTWNSDYILRIWDASTGKQILALKHKEYINGAQFNADETRVLTWSNSTVRIWAINTGEQIGQDLEHREYLNGGIFSPKGTKVLTCCKDGTIRLWDFYKGEQIGPVFEHEVEKIIAKLGYLRQMRVGEQRQLVGAKFNAEGTKILTWSYDSTVRIWDVKTGKQIGPILKHDRFVLGAAFNKEDSKILTFAEDKTVRILDIATDLDFPKEKIKLQVWALTGTRLNTKTMQVESIEPVEWRKIKKEYMEFAREHYKICKYPRANVFARLFPEEAEKVRRQKTEDRGEL